jgi:hypothetical protein
MISLRTVKGEHRKPQRTQGNNLCPQKNREEDRNAARAYRGNHGLFDFLRIKEFSGFSVVKY